MPPVIVDIGVVVLILGMTYALASEGLWGAALMSLNALFSGLISFNFYEPLAAMLAGSLPAMSGYADALCMLVLFGVSLLVLRLTTDSLGPTLVRFPTPVYHIGRWSFALMGATITMSVLLLAFHVSPGQKKMFYGAYPYDRKPPFGMGIDWNWLSFFQYTTGQAFASYNNDPEGAKYDPRVFDGTTEYTVNSGGKTVSARVFDPRGRWLIDHQNARPYGDGFVPDPGAATAGGAAGGAPAAPGQPGMGIPGGTAGAAVGLCLSRSDNPSVSPEADLDKMWLSAANHIRNLITTEPEVGRGTEFC